MILWFAYNRTEEQIVDEYSMYIQVIKNSLKYLCLRNQIS
jgi:hypothetical protein